MKETGQLQDVQIGETCSTNGTDGKCIQRFSQNSTNGSVVRSRDEWCRTRGRDSIKEKTGLITKTTPISVAGIREIAIPTERPLLVGEVSANF
jgi:hypothetical protein